MMMTIIMNNMTILKHNYHDDDKVVRCGLARPDEAHMLGTETSAEMYGR